MCAVDVFYRMAISELTGILTARAVGGGVEYVRYTLTIYLNVSFKRPLSQRRMVMRLDPYISTLGIVYMTLAPPSSVTYVYDTLNGNTWSNDCSLFNRA